jgi:hypothetical protein
MRPHDPFAQKFLHFVRARIGMLVTDPGARDITREFVEIERELQSLFASHRTIFLELLLKRCLGSHEKILIRFC